MSPTDLTILGAMAGLLVGSGMFSSSETALYSLQEGELAAMSRPSDTVGGIIVNLLNESHRLLLSILIGNNAINIAYFALAGLWARMHAESMWSIIIPIASLAGLILLGEILPKVAASRQPAVYARLIAVPMQLAHLAIRPIGWLLQPVLRHLLDDDDVSDVGAVSADELKMVIERSREHGVVSPLAHDRLIEIVDLSETPIYQVMTHRVDVPSIPVNESRKKAIKALRDKPGPLLFLTDPDTEDCVGVLTAQDLVRGGKPSKRSRKPLFIPESAQLAQAVSLFQRTGATYGVVVDEYGGTAGLLTLAHLGNELLGSGQSEDIPDAPIEEQLAKDTWRVSGHMPIEDWEPLLGSAATEDCTTLAGFLAKQMGAVPEVGDRLLFNNLQFEVESVDHNRIRTIILKQLSVATARRLTGPQGLR